MKNQYIPNKDLVYKIGPLYMEQVRDIEVLLREGALVACCNCGKCGYMHTSDCGVHSGPEFVSQRCDCRTDEASEYEGYQRCAYCHELYLTPVRLHHSEDKCV